MQERALDRNKYCTNALFQAAYRRAKATSTDILTYVIDDETTITSKQQTKALELAYLVEINRLNENATSPTLNFVVLNIDSNSTLYYPPTEFDLWPDPQYWDNYWTYCYKKDAKSRKKRGLEKRTLEDYRNEKQNYIWRRNNETFSTSERGEYDMQAYQRDFVNE